METYRTKDLFEAAWLHSQNVTFLKLEPDNHYFWFVFSNDNGKTTTLSQEYWSQQAIGNTKTYVNSLKTLKDLLFSQR